MMRLDAIFIPSALMRCLVGNDRVSGRFDDFILCMTVLLCFGPLDWALNVAEAHASGPAVRYKYLK